MDLVYLALLYIWSEARTARQLAAVAAAEVTADPLTWDALKKRAVDRGLDSIINLALP
jgi:hypothetical protein